MKTAILTGGSDKEFNLLLELAKTLGIKAKILSDEQLEDAGMVKAIKTARTGKTIDTNKFLKGLK
jgi:adenosylcobinamide amidohydrolase